MSAQTEMIQTVRSIFAIICITILSIVAITEGMDGDIMRIAIGIIGLLGGTEVIAEYWIRRKNSGEQI